MKTAADRPSQDRPANGGVSGSSQQDDSLRCQRRGTLVEFFDEFERASLKFPAHREMVIASKRAAKQLRENVWPGMLFADYDWAENGLIAAARQIQSEYWCLKYFSLFIVIVSYLKAEEWLVRDSLLQKGAEVTVEPEGSPANTLKPATGSIFARVIVAAASPGEESLYTVEWRMRMALCVRFNVADCVSVSSTRQRLAASQMRNGMLGILLLTS